MGIHRPDADLEKAVVAAEPALGKTAGHSQGANNVGVLTGCIGEDLAMSDRLHRCPRRPAHTALGCKGYGDDRRGAKCCRNSDRGVKDIERDEEDRYPGHVEKRRRTDAGKESPHLIEIAQRLLRDKRTHSLEWKRRQCKVDWLLQSGIEQRPDPREHAGAQRIKIALQHVGQQHDE